jgi:hypothetical protein
MLKAYTHIVSAHPATISTRCATSLTNGITGQTSA